MKTLSLLTLFLFISCLSIKEPLEPEVLAAPQKECKDDTTRTSSSRVIASHQECHQLSLYACDMRIFSPEVETETKLAQELCQSGDCFKYDLYQYNTAHIEGADYEEGGEYNYQEVSCWHSKNRKLHIDGKEIEEVMEKLILSCETRAQI